MGNRKRWVRALIASVMLLWAMLVPQPATAHAPEYTKSGIMYGEPGFCVHGAVTQGHSWHSIGTQMSNCQNVVSTWHAQYQEYYKVRPGDYYGRYCFYEPERQSNNQQSFSKLYTWDIWYWCNDGGGVNVMLTVDSWQWSWDGRAGNPGWKGNAWRPATSHCHCP